MFKSVLLSTVRFIKRQETLMKLITKSDFLNKKIRKLKKLVLKRYFKSTVPSGNLNNKNKPNKNTKASFIQTYTKANRLSNCGKFEEALNLYRIIYTLNNNDEIAAEILYCSVKLGDFNLARSFYETVSHVHLPTILQRRALIEYRKANGYFDSKSIELALSVVRDTHDSHIIELSIDFLWEIFSAEKLVEKNGFPWFDITTINSKTRAKLCAIYLEGRKYQELNQNIRLLIKDKDIKYISKYAALKEYVSTNFFIDNKSNVTNRILVDNYKTLLDDISLAQSIAIVGNSPCEVGTSKGEAIDKHDMVIRFNNYPTTEEYLSDYGQKTQVWVRSIGNWVDKRNDVAKTTVLCGINLNNRGFSPKPYEELVAKTSLTVFDSALFYRLSTILAAPPSAGLITCFMVYSVKGQLNKKSLFGFGFIDQLDSSVVNMGNSPAGERHDWEGELRCFQMMIDGTL